MREFSLRLNLVVMEKYSLALRSQQKADHRGRQSDRLNASNLRESLYHTVAHIVAEIPAFELTLLRFFQELGNNSKKLHFGLGKLQLSCTDKLHWVSSHTFASLTGKCSFRLAQ